MLGVISCPKCKNVCGINLKQKSKKCIKCDYAIKIKKVRIWVKTSEHSNLPELIKKVKEKIENTGTNSLDYWRGLILYTVCECDQPNNEEKLSRLEKSRKTTMEMA